VRSQEVAHAAAGSRQSGFRNRILQIQDQRICTCRQRLRLFALAISRHEEQ
jgi:hypothetical protein